MNRRQFLQSSLALLANIALSQRVYATPHERRLLLIELKGGNDGLNTVIPYTDPLYYQLRPRIAIPRNQILPLDQRTGLHPALQPLLPIWNEGELAIMQGVGYKDPNRSHFRSIEIWETGSESHQYLDQGWLAESLRSFTSPSAIADAVAIGKASQGGINGTGVRSLVVGQAEKFLQQASRLREIDHPTENPALAHLLIIQNQVKKSADQFAQNEKMSVHGNRPGFANDMRQAASLFISDQSPQVVKVSLGSFDTHANQLNKHARLLTQFATSIAAFRKEMLEKGLWQEMLIMTYSEFGRRVKQNGSNGTDHGTAAPHFMIGGAVKGGFYGSQPSLSDLDRGDLKYTLDFHQLYATVEKEWWKRSGNELGVFDL